MATFFPDENKYTIYEGNFWNVILHQNQSYLGRCIVYQSRINEDPLLLTKEERDELWQDILPRLVRALRAAFQPNRVNYAYQANEVHQVHWHVVPRYEMNPVREFAGEIFKDERVGKNYSPYTKQREFSHGVLETICLEIRKHF